MFCNGKKEFLLRKPTQTTGKLMIRTSKLHRVIVHFLRNEETTVIFCIFVWMALQFFRFACPERSTFCSLKVLLVILSDGQRMLPIDISSFVKPANIVEK